MIYISYFYKGKTYPRRWPEDFAKDPVLEWGRLRLHKHEISRDDDFMWTQT